MTANKLIEELQKLPPETEVYTLYPYDQSEVPVTSLQKCYEHDDGVVVDYYEKEILLPG